MPKLLLYKVFSAFIALFLSGVIIFTLIRLTPGDPVKIMLGGVGDIPITNTEAYEKRVLELREELGLNDSVVVQYVNWITRAVRLDFGTSIVTGRLVSEEIGQRLPATLILTTAAILIQTFFGMALGVLSSVHAKKIADEGIRIICVLIASLPGFFIGLVGLYLFGVQTHLFRVGTSGDLNRLWLPAITLGILGIPQLTRVVRANMLNQFGECYISSLIARGLPRKLIIKNALRNALPPVITMLALTLTALLGGSVVIENIFSWPGIGAYAMKSVLNHDYPVIQAYSLLMVSIVIGVNLFVDFLYAVFDRKSRCLDK